MDFDFKKCKHTLNKCIQPTTDPHGWLFLLTEPPTKVSIDEKKRKPSEGLQDVGDKKSKIGGSSLLVRKTLTSGMMLSTSPSVGSSLSSSLLGSTGLSLKLDTSLSKLRLGGGTLTQLSHASSSLSSSLAVKPSMLGHTGDSSAKRVVSSKPRSAEEDGSRSKLGKSKKKKMKMEGKITTVAAQEYERYRMALPEYKFSSDERDEPMDLVSFIPPEKDVTLTTTVISSIVDVAGLKVVCIVNSVDCSSSRVLVV